MATALPGCGFTLTLLLLLYRNQFAIRFAFVRRMRRMRNVSVSQRVCLLVSVCVYVRAYSYRCLTVATIAI